MTSYGSKLPNPPADIELEMVVKITTLKVRLMSINPHDEMAIMNRNRQMITFLNDYFLSLSIANTNNEHIIASFSAFDPRSSRWYGKLVNTHTVMSCDISIGLYQDRHDPSLLVIDSRRVQGGDTKLFIQDFFHPFAAMIQGREGVPAIANPMNAGPVPAHISGGKRDRVEELDSTPIVREEDEQRSANKRRSPTPSSFPTAFTPSASVPVPVVMPSFAIPRMSVENYLANMQSTLRLLRESPYTETKIMALSMLANAITTSTLSMNGSMNGSIANSNEKEYVEDVRVYSTILNALQEVIVPTSLTAISGQSHDNEPNYALQEVAVFALNLLVKRIPADQLLVYMSPVLLQWLQQQIVVAPTAFEHLTIAMQRTAANILARLATASTSALTLAMKLFHSSTDVSNFSQGVINAAGSMNVMQLTSIVEALQVWSVNTVFTLVDPDMFSSSLQIVQAINQALIAEIERAS